MAVRMCELGIVWHRHPEKTRSLRALTAASTTRRRVLIADAVVRRCIYKPMTELIEQCEFLTFLIGSSMEQPSSREMYWPLLIFFFFFFFFFFFLGSVAADDFSKTPREGGR